MKVSALLGLILVFVSIALAFTSGKIEPVSRSIVYFHVPVAVCSLVCFLFVFVASIAFLRTRKIICDSIAVRSAAAGVIFSFLMNASGMIFAKNEWGIWWSPSPRLVSSALLLFLYLVYFLLRSSLPAHRKQTVSAVFGIIAFLDVPIVFVSARFLPDIHRPNIAFEQPAQWLVLISGIIGLVLLTSAWIFSKRNRP